jgi:hypothetical protein
MKYIKPLLVIVFVSPTLFALPFSITPLTNSPFPTFVSSGAITYASYVVRNNTNRQRNHNYIKYLPPNVTALNSGCLIDFNLAPGQECILNLLIKGSVNANDQDPHHHLFICFQGGKTCAGTARPLNVSMISGVGYSALSSIAVYQNGVYTAGLNTNNSTEIWQSQNNSSWKNANLYNPGASINSISTVSESLIYYVGSQVVSRAADQGYVLSYNPQTLQSTNLHFYTSTSATNAQSSTYGNNALYVGGTTEDINTATTGRVWKFRNGAWSETPIIDNNINSVIDLAYDSTSQTVFGVFENNGSSTTSKGNYVEVYVYNGTIWSSLELPNSDSGTYLVHASSIAVVGPNEIYVGGVDSNYNAAVWKYNGTIWNELTTPSTGGEIYNLALNSNGTLYAAGFDGQNFRGQIWYYKNTQWNSLNLFGSLVVNAMAINSNNMLYASGVAWGGVGNIWTINANA